MRKGFCVIALILGVICMASVAMADQGDWYSSSPKYKRIVIVDAIGNRGFKSVAEAYASLGTTTPDRPSLIKIMPGSYDIGALVLDKNFIDIEGSGAGVTILSAVVPDLGEFTAIYQYGLGRLSGFSLDIRVGSNRLADGVINGIHTFANQGHPLIMSDLSVTSRFQDGDNWPNLTINAIVASANNMLQYSLIASNITVNLNLPGQQVSGNGIQTYGKVSLTAPSIVATGGNVVYGLILGMSSASTITDAQVYVSGQSATAFMPVGTNSFSATQSFFHSSGRALLANNGALGEIHDSVLDGTIYDPLDRYSNVDAGVVLINCVDGSGAPINFPYTLTNPGY